MRALLRHSGAVYHTPTTTSRPAVAPAAVAVASSSRRRQQQQQSQRAHQQPQRQRDVAARVRIDDLDSPTQGPAAAAEALQAYMQLEQSGELNLVTAGNVRLKYGIRRGDADGRVQVRKSDGTWMQVKLDMEVRGTILLRNTADDTIYVLQTERLEQVDLSDDYVLFMLFADGSWEEQIIPIQLADETGGASTLEMGAQQFKDYVGLIKTLREAEQEAMQQAAAAAGRQQQGGVQDDEDGAIDVMAEVTSTSSNGRL